MHHSPDQAPVLPIRPALRTSTRWLSCVILLLGLSAVAVPTQLQAQTIYSNQTIYGWSTFTGTTGGNCVVNTAFTTATNWGRRYHVVVKNGATAATSVTVSIDGQQWVGASEFHLVD